MIKSELLKSVHIVPVGKESSEKHGGLYTVSVVEGEPVALNDTTPVLSIRISDLNEDLPRLVQAAERLLPAHRQAPGIVALNTNGEVLGVVPRKELEDAVLLRRGHRYPELAKNLGMERSYREPAGDPAAPFVYWACPTCDSICIPNAGRENDAPPLCRRHDPPIRMKRLTHPGQ
jgi:hypothetical protein